MKTCTTCGETKPLSEYYNDRRASDDKVSRCAACCYGAYKDWRARNREKNLSKNSRAQAKRATFLRDAKDRPCDRCGGRFPPIVMDFHHRDPATKEFDVSRAGRSYAKLAAEVAKCDVLCANCHRMEHSDGVWSGD